MYGLIKGKISNITVNGGETVTAPDIVLSIVNNTRNRAYFNNLKVVDSLGSNYYLYPNAEILMPSSEITINGYAKRDYGYYLDTLISFQVNDGQIITTNSSKGWFAQSVTLQTIKNNIKIWIGEDKEKKNIFESTIIYLDKIQNINIELNWYSVIYNISAGDFDIHLINNETNDSCWYNNSNPDWGIQDIIYDNPDLSDNANEYENSDVNENLEIYSAADGSYTLKVYYFSNHQNNTLKITPVVYLSLNSQYYTFTAPSAMSVGNIWTVTTINVPFDKSTKSINKIEHISVKNSPKK